MNDPRGHDRERCSWCGETEDLADTYAKAYITRAFPSDNAEQPIITLRVVLCPLCWDSLRKENPRL